MRNLAGEADTLRLSTTITGRGRKAEADYTIPYAYTNSTALALGAFYEEMERPSFTSSTYGVTPRLIWRATDRQTYRLGFRLQQVETTDVEPGVDSGEVLNFQFLAPFISATYDRRNSTRLPRRGFIIGVHAEWTGEDVGSDISYTRIDGNVTGYVPLGDRVTLASSFKGGRIIPMEDTETIPISLRYFAGGATTVRGFEEQVLGPTVNGEPTGGEVYTALQTEMRYRIVGNFYGALFGDVGNVYTTWADVDITDQRYGVGGGIRIFTPAGALVLDLGVNPEPEPEESSSVLYFSFGMPF
jgi:translocation and assembly module TamA